MTRIPGTETAPTDAPAAAADSSIPADAPADAETRAFDAMRAVDAAGAEALRREWGADFARNLELARRAAAAVADDGLIAALEEAGLGDDPRIVRAAAAIGRLLERADHGGDAPDGPARQALEQELDRLVARPDYWSDPVQRRVRRIFLDLHGSRPLPVHRAAGDASGM